ncbi:DNA-3-methyladenine glycosylase [Natronoglycomyces albus]|uniref:DNA-3-methyladenine glycosylase n=1 Tax=Natronoglycomyces albus TaxID=2811108 RepID=UPI001FEC6219|nr:DNA-3-methyladenine glycosylase [Natronoglycomyces albus]
MLPREFFRAPASQVAPRLLGCVVRSGPVAVRITEVEAYDQSDPASHSFKGPTRARRTMFGPPGHLYVYFTYGMHFCGNLTCEDEGRGAGVLLRSGEVVDGLDVAWKRRGNAVPFRNLARGPARLAQAMGWTREDDGSDYLDSVTAGDPIEGISVGPRVGVANAADTPWRFWITDDRFVSAYRRHSSATP